jgi:hypothetical protein
MPRVENYLCRGQKAAAGYGVVDSSSDVTLPKLGRVAFTSRLTMVRWYAN